MNKFVFTVCLLFCINLAQSQYNLGIQVEQVLKTDSTYAGQALHYPQFDTSEVTILRITIPPGDSTGWHKHKIPVFACVLEGSLSVELENNKVVTFSQGSSFAEVIDTFHNGFNSGPDNLVLLAFYLGEKGKALSEKKQVCTDK